jgi:flagellar hook-associated protein 2
MDSLGSLDQFEVYKTSSTDDTAVTASTDSSAEVGTFSIAVTQLAQSHKMASTGFTDSSTSIGATLGDINIQLGTDPANSFDVTITDDSLAGIRDAINNSADNLGVTATIINVDDGIGGTESKLILTSDETGTDNAITVSDVGAATVASTLTMATVTGHDAKDAVFTVDGFDVTRSSNTIDDVIQGVTLTLKTEGSSADISIEHDLDTIKSNVQDFVDKYNNLQSKLAGLRTGDLQGDSTLLSIESQLRSVLNTAPTGLTTSLQFLSEIGITTLRDGSLSFDSSNLEDALNNDFNGVAELLANDDQGYAFRFGALADGLLDLEGVIKTREDGINTRIGSIDDGIANWEYRLESIEARYRSQFTALDSLLSELQTTSSYLTQQLSSLANLQK